MLLLLLLIVIMALLLFVYTVVLYFGDISAVRVCYFIATFDDVDSDIDVANVVDGDTRLLLLMVVIEQK
jgi:hypothetical protein